MLSTGEMIDRLKAGEVAEIQNKPFDFMDSKGSKVTYKKSIIRWQDTNEPFVINDYTKEFEWRILPQYVSFEEAMKALEEGKSITWHKWNNGDRTLTFDRCNTFDLFVDHDIDIDEFCEGKWTIEGDNT